MTFNGKGFNGSFKFDVEGSFGAGAPTDPTWKRGSDFIRDVTISTAHERVKLRDISSEKLQKVVNATKKWELEVEYVPQRPASGDQTNQLFNYHDRDSSTETGLVGGSSGSLYIEISYGGVVLHASGCASDDLNPSGSKNEELVMSQSFKVKELTVDESASSGTASSIGTEPYVFGAGAFTRNGSPIAYATESFDVTISNNIEDDIVDISSDTVKMFVVGQLDISGSTDIVAEPTDITSIFSDADSATKTGMELDLGDASGDDILNFSNAYWTDPEFNPTTDKPVVRESVPFEAYDWSLGQIS